MIGDEILAVNEESVIGYSHNEAIAVFKRIRSGPVKVHTIRKEKWILVLVFLLFVLNIIC